MRVLVACEFSGIVRDAFIARGHYAVSCDLLPTDGLWGPHIQDDVLDHLDNGWDMMVAFPPCTHLSASGARWWKDKQYEQAAALYFVRQLMASEIPMIAIENPVGRISSAIRKPDQIIQPWQFGNPESKSTCLWLKGLPLLRPTKVLVSDTYGCSCGTRFDVDMGKYGCPNCLGEGKTKLIFDNQTPTGQNRLSSGQGRQRSKTYSGIAQAMADQWG